MGVTVQGEHDGPEEDRSDPEGRGARGPAASHRRGAGKKSTNELVHGGDAVASGPAYGNGARSGQGRGHERL